MYSTVFLINSIARLEKTWRSVQCKLSTNRVNKYNLMLDPTPEAPSAKGIARLTVHIPSAFRQNVSKPPPSRWNTVEFRFYYVVALFIIPAMFWIPISLSLRTFGIFMTRRMLSLRQLHIQITIVTSQNCRKVGFTIDLS